MSLNNHCKCEYCGSTAIVPSHGFYVCKDCGTVGDRIFEDSSYQIKETATRKVTQYVSIGNRLTRTGNLGSEIGYYKSNHMKENNGTFLEPLKSWKFRRLRDSYHIPAKNASSQTHLRTFMIFNKVSSQLQLPNTIKERASYLYWKYSNHHRKKITNHVLLIALCVLFAVKESGNKYPFKFQEIVQAFNESGHRVTNKNILKLATSLNIPLSRTPPRKSEDYLERIVSYIIVKQIKKEIAEKYGLTPSTYRNLLLGVSAELLSQISSKERGGVQPYPFAASVVYIADRAISRYLKKVPILTQKKVACLTGAKEFTIRDHCYKLLSRVFEREKSKLYQFINHFLNS